MEFVNDFVLLHPKSLSIDIIDLIKINCIQNQAAQNRHLLDRSSKVPMVLVK